MKTFNASITRKTYITPDTVELELHYEEEFTFLSGQFVMVTIPQEPGAPMCKRAYSIASSPTFKNGKALLLCIKIVPEGKASMYFDQVQEDTTLELMGPVGHFTLKDPSHELFFVATGTGFAPFKAMLEDLAHTGRELPVTMFFGVRFEKDIFYKEFLDEFAKAHSWFHYHIAVSRPEDDWDGITGRVTDVYIQHYRSKKNAHFYLCGNGAMIDSMKDLLTEDGHDKTSLHFEKYFT